MIAKLRSLFEKKDWSCRALYGANSEELFVAVLRLAPSGSCLELSEENAQHFRKNYSSWAQNRSVAFGTGGVAIRINEDFVERIGGDLSENLVNVPEIYCLELSGDFLFSVVNQREVVDYQKEFESVVREEFSSKT